MRFRLLPTDEKFFELFQQSAANAALCARSLAELLDAPDDQALFEKVLGFEKEGDSITSQILERLDTSFVTPFDREDIHSLAEELDDCVDDMQAVAHRLELTGVRAIPPELREQAAVLIEMADEAAELMARLESMQGLGPHLEAIDRLESQGDDLHHRALGRLYSGDVEALDVLRWKDLIELMEQSMNAIEDISDVVESIVLKHS
jgi:predicted phosphate transport protein (TIGR00153 family)